MQAENNEVDDDDNVQQLPAVLVNIVFCLRVWRCSPSSPTACRLILYHIYRHHWQPHAHVFVVVVYFYVLCVYTLCVCMCVSFTYKHLYQFMSDCYIVTQDYQFLRLILPDIYLSFDIYLQWVQATALQDETSQISSRLSHGSRSHCLAQRMGMHRALSTFYLRIVW